MAKKRATRTPAARTLTGPGKQYKVGRGGRGSPKGSRRGAPLLRPLLSRLRRLEVLVLHLYGRLELEPDVETKMLDNVQELKDDTEDADGDKSRNTEV